VHRLPHLELARCLARLVRDGLVHVGRHKKVLE
jgi:hypothetical protein